MNQQPNQTIAQLWADAIKEYNKELEEDAGPRRSPTNSPSKGADVMTLQEKGEDANTLFSDVLSGHFEFGHSMFIHVRHPGTRGDRVRTALRNVCNHVQDAIGLAGDIASLAYPPASAISQALLFVLKACNGVSEKLDEIEKFYEKIQYFFERLSLIERRLPPEHAFGEPLIRVFIAILNVCGTARKYIRDGRTITFFKGLIGMDDGLADHLKDITDRMNDLESTVIMATLGVVTQAKKEFEFLLGKLGSLLQGRSSPNVPGVGLIEDRESPQTILSNRRECLPHISERDRGSRNFEAFTRILSQLSSGTEVPLRGWMKEMERRYVKGTCMWIEKELLSLLRGDNALQRIYITGERGTGKTMLAFYVYRYLKHLYQLKPSGEYVVIYFSFSIESGRVWTVEDMLSHCILQIAEEDEPRRARIQKSLASSGGEPDLVKLLVSAFDLPKGNLRRLFVVADGTDSIDTKHFDNTIHTISANLPVTLVLPRWGIPKEHNQRKKILLDKNRLRSELPQFAKARLETFPRLRILPAHRKDRIVQVVCDGADGFLYVDQILHRLNTSGNGFLTQLKHLDTTELVFKALFEACFKRRTHPEQLQIHCLFVWLTYTKAHMSLSAASMLMSIISDWIISGDLQIPLEGDVDSSRGLNIHREIDTRLARLLAFSAIPVEVPTSLNEVIRRDEDGDDDYNTMFGFSAPWLPDYYQANFTSLFSYDNRFLMLKMAASILTTKDGSVQSGDMPMAAQTRVRAERELVSYASSLWSEYLYIGSNTTTSRKEDGARLVSKIMCNENGAMRRLEDHGRVKNPQRLSILSEDGFGRLQELCHGISFSMAEEADAAHLVEQVRKGHEAYSLYVAKKHVGSWWTAETPLEAYTSFRFVRQSIPDAFPMNPNSDSYNYRPLIERGLEPEEIDIESLGEIQNEEVFQMTLFSEALGHWRSCCGDDCNENTTRECRRATQLRCRAMALRFAGRYEEALRDISQALLCQKSDSGEEWKFKLLVRQGRIHFGQSEDANLYSGGTAANLESDPPDEKRHIALDGALGAFREALAVIPEHAHRRYDEKTLMIHQMSAKVAAMLDKAGDCLQSVSEATQYRPERQPQVLVYFKDIVSALAANGRWEHILELLAKVPKQQLAAGCTSQTHETLHRAVVKGNEAGRMLLDSMYEESANALQNGSMPLPANSVRVWWAIFKRRIKRDLEGAKVLLQDVLKSSDNEVDAQTVTSASWQLGEILLGEFYGVDWSAANGSAGEMLTRREEIHNGMGRLVRTVTNLIPNFQNELSQTSILLTLMQIGMGSIKLAQRQADGVFDACRKALTDDIASNDFLGFQMLAKILAVVPALMDHAKNAASCQFYTVDEQLDKQEPDTYSLGYGYDPILSLEQKAPADGTNTRILKARKGEYLEEHAAFRVVRCSGSCGRAIGSNLEIAYLCYYCTNTTLCNDCYRSRAGNQDEWRVRCPGYHRHIEFPLSGANRLTKDQLKEWLEWLKGEWNKAWVDFVQIAVSGYVPDSQSTKRQRVD